MLFTLFGNIFDLPTYCSHLAGHLQLWGQGFLHSAVYNKIGTEIIRRVIPQGQFQTVIENFLVSLRLRESSSDKAKMKQIYRSRRTRIDQIKKDISNEFNIPLSSHDRLYSSVDEHGQTWEPVDDRPDSTLEVISLTKNAFIIYEDRVPLSPPVKSPLCRTEFTRGLCGLSN